MNSISQASKYNAITELTPISPHPTQFEVCPICSSSIKTWRIKIIENVKYKVDLCKSCGYAFVNPRPSISFLMDYYSSFGHGHDGGGKKQSNLEEVLARELNYPNSTIDSARLVGTAKSLSKTCLSNRFLDVGCGFGFFSKAAADSGFQVISLELAKNEREIAAEFSGINPVACSFEDFEYDAESIQVVCMSQILEHALDVNLWIGKARSLLVDNGLIAIALPNFGSLFRLVLQENDPYIIPPAHLNYFNLNSLSKLLKNHGFRVEVVQWVSRIPVTAFEKRLPTFGKPILPFVNMLSSTMLKAIDSLHLGMMINVYARKITI